MRTPLRSDRPATPETASTPPAANVKRRRFLFSLGASGAGAAATALCALPAAAAAQPAVEPTKDSAGGYRETEHVRDYYRSAKL
jgi:hypothetical protein